jgi:hypothetical protein
MKLLGLLFCLGLLERPLALEVISIGTLFSPITIPRLPFFANSGLAFLANFFYLFY